MPVVGGGYSRHRRARGVQRRPHRATAGQPEAEPRSGHQPLSLRNRVVSSIILVFLGTGWGFGRTKPQIFMKLAQII